MRRSCEQPSGTSVDLLGHRYHLECHGDPDGETVLFLHGFSQSTRTWYPVVEELLKLPGGDGLRLVLLDLIGHGLSDKPSDERPYTLAHMVDVLEALRIRLGGGRVHVVGYSMGGRIALSYAVRDPGSLLSLVLESSAFGPRSAAERAAMSERDRALADRLRRSTPEQFAQWWAQMPVLASQSGLPEALREAEAAMRMGNEPRALALMTMGAGQGAMDDLWDAAAHLPVPLTYLVGVRDERYSAIASEAQDAWGLDVRRFPTGHNVHLEEPEEYARVLLGLLAKGRERG